MRATEFKQWYEMAQKGGDVVNDSTFLVAGYFWINLTEKQTQKMSSLMVKQGAQVVDGWVELANGLRIRYKGREQMKNIKLRYEGKKNWSDTEHHRVLEESYTLAEEMSKIDIERLYSGTAPTFKFKINRFDRIVVLFNFDTVIDNKEAKEVFKRLGYKASTHGYEL